MRLRELAACWARFGYRRLTMMVRREGWRFNAMRIYRLHTEDGGADQGAQENRGVHAGTAG